MPATIEGGVSVIKSIGVGALIVSLAFVPAARADECGDAVRDYKRSSAAWKTRCSSSPPASPTASAAHSCSREFRQLQSAYGEYESAVSVYTKQCI